MLLITLCVLLLTGSALPSHITPKTVNDATVRIPYSVNCTSNANQILLTTTPQHYPTVQSTKWPLLIGLQDSAVALCGHTDWLVLHSIVSADESTSSFITSSTFYDSNQTLTAYLAAYLTDLSKQASGNSTRRSISRREGIDEKEIVKATIISQLVSDALRWTIIFRV